MNAYGPTSQRVKENPSVSEQFYTELASAINAPSRYLVFVCGDFNSKLGKRTTADIEAGLEFCLGTHGMGTRNDNGETLANFMTMKSLFACNTAFQHASRHKTTWTGWLRDPSAPPGTSKTVAVYTQIDFVLCKQNAKLMLQDARSYGGATMCSDHKPVVARLCFNRRCLVYRQPKKHALRTIYDTARLVCNEDTRNAYLSSLNKKINDMPTSTDPNVRLRDILRCVKEAANETVGVTPPSSHKRGYTQDPLVSRLSTQQRALRLRIEATGNSTDRTTLRRERSHILKQINKRLREVACRKADTLASEITATDDARKMFKAVKAMKSVPRTPSLCIQDQEGKFIATNRAKANAIRKWFEQRFNDPSAVPLAPFVGPGQPLNQPITTLEIERAMKLLQNGRAPGPDSVNNELLKYAPGILSAPLEETINAIFEQHVTLEELGQGTLVALPKPGKPRGPLTSLRPIVLLNSVRKIISTITLQRIRPKVDAFTGASQSGFKRGRSCADIIWAQRMLTSIVMARHWDFHKMGIDMSRAFDTINREKILDVLTSAGCEADDLRLVRVLLAGTNITVRVGSSQSTCFDTTIGSPQGDNLSPVLFTCYLAAALRCVRSFSGRPDPPITSEGLPHEWEYADDVDFVDEEREPLDSLLQAACSQLREWNLQVNESKTEFTHIHLANTTKTDDPNEVTRGNETWRSNKSLGSLLCSSKDITHRCVLGNLSFRSFWSLWMHGPKIPLQKRLRVYHAMCVSTMLYNCSSWAAPKAILNKLDACHRRHLRSILAIHWPNTISNETLYKRCNTRPLSEMVTEARWNMLGHVLRMDQNAPAQTALRYAVEGAKKYKSRRGRHTTNLLDTLKKDIKERMMDLRNTADLESLRKTAADKARWREMLAKKD